jgi:hypothetical protein
MIYEDGKGTSFGPTMREVHTTFRYFLGDLLAISRTHPILTEIGISLGRDTVKKMEEVFQIFDDHFEKMGYHVAKHVSRLDPNSRSRKDKRRIEYIESAVNDLCDAQVVSKTKGGDFTLGRLGKDYLRASIHTNDPLRSFHRLVYFRIVGHFLQRAERLSQFLIRSGKTVHVVSDDRQEINLEIRCPREMMERFVLINAEGRPHLSRGSVDNNYPHSLSLEAFNRFIGFVSSLRRELFRSYSRVSGSQYSESTLNRQASLLEGILSSGDRPFLVRESTGGYTRIPDPALPAMVSLAGERHGPLSDVFRLCEVLRDDFSVVVDPKDVMNWVETSRLKGVDPDITRPLLSQNFSRFIARLEAFQLARQEPDGRIALRLA